MNPVAHTARRVPDGLITPDQVVSMLVGADSIRVSGFGGAPVECPFWMPMAGTYSSDLASQAVNRALATKRRYMALVLCAAVILVTVTAFFLGRAYDLAGQSPASSSSWITQAVTNDGVIILVMGVQPITVPVGAVLPNGEILKSVNIRSQTFSTDHHETAIKK